jgi:hypothetical protein
MPQQDIVGDTVREVTQSVKDSVSKFTKPVTDAIDKAKSRMNPPKETTWIEPAPNHQAAQAHGTTHAAANSEHSKIAKARK